VLDQEQHRLVDLGRLDEVVVVEHQDDPAGERGQVVDQQSDHGIQGGRRRQQRRLPEPGRRRHEHDRRQLAVSSREPPVQPVPLHHTPPAPGNVRRTDVRAAGGGPRR
jgi:hypothetical protein